MTISVALAMLQRDGRWLLQLRDDIDSIIYPGHWGLFGGHVEPGESPADAVQRELMEEISWAPSTLLLHCRWTLLACRLRCRPVGRSASNRWCW